jgi:hypothetical protein
VLLRRLTLVTFTLQTLNPPRLLIEDCAGSVWLENCWIRGLSPTSNAPGSDALRVTGSDAVVVMRSTLDGGDGPRPTATSSECVANHL